MFLKTHIMKTEHFLHFIGIDISKSTFDIAIISGNTTTSHVFDNTPKGARAFLRLLRNRKIHLGDSLICMEHTGVYGKIIIAKLFEKKANFCVEMAFKIIRSLGLQRGKTDKVDAVRIAQYALKNHSGLELYRPVPEVLEKAKVLMKIREQLVQARANLNKYPNELQTFAPELGKLARKNTKRINKSLNEEIGHIEGEIKALILSDEQLNTTIGLVTSVTGIGIVTALYLTIYTNFFTRYQNPKQLACYCGVVPFDHVSGSSIQKRSRIHHMANRTLKTQLHMCALSAMNHDPDIKAYFHRKVGEGKNKMLILNNIRNKLVLRVCAVIKRQRPYVKTAA